MRGCFSKSISLAGVVAFLLCASLASAQASRTWVSGVGDDANPCSRTAPCKTFAGAISKTAAAGVIDVLDPGGFGAVTITKSITIEAVGTVAGVLVSATNGIIVNAAAADVVVLRGLSIEGLGTGLDGVHFIGGQALTVEGCVINGFAGNAISFQPATGAGSLIVKDTIAHNMKGAGAGGILIKPAAGASAVALIDNVRLERTNFGVRVEDGSTATVRNSVITKCAVGGVTAVSAGGSASISLDGTALIKNSGAAVTANGAMAQVRLAHVTVFDNASGLVSLSSGKILSFGNNMISDSGTPTGPIPLM
jgi:hypothetical protein